MVRDLRILVTGASGGLGPTLVEALLAMGASVIAAARRRTALDDLRAELKNHDRLRTAECDVTDADGVAALFDSLERAAPIDGVLHAAGTFAGGRLAEMDTADIDRLVRTNLLSTAYVLREALARMVPRGAGSIVVIGADRVLEPTAGVAAYGASKAGAVHLVEAAAKEAARSGVRLNAILPGTIDTPGNRAAMPDADAGKWAPPSAIARAAIFLLGRESLGITGSLVRIPGG